MLLLEFYLVLNPLWEKWSFEDLCDSIYGIETERIEEENQNAEVNIRGTFIEKSRSYLEGNIFSNIMHFLLIQML